MLTNVLLADDDSDDLMILTDALQAINPAIKLDVVPDASSLLSHLQHLVPDILFMDLDMPYKNGLQCLVEIRNNPSLQGLPVVVFSSTSRPANIQTAYEMGGHLFLVKSAHYNELKSSIEAILSLDWTNPEEVKAKYCVNNRYAAFA